MMASGSKIEEGGTPMRIPLRGVLLLLAVVTWLQVSRAQAEDWYRWRGPRLNGISSETDWTDQWPKAGPPIAWRASVGVGFASVAVSEGRLYTLGNQDNSDVVHCLDANTGKSLWTYRYEAPLDDREFEGGPTATPTVDSGRVYTLSRQGRLFALDAASGKLCWNTDVREAAGVRVPGWGFASSPLVHGDLILLSVGEAGTAVNKATGKLAWKSADKDAGYATPVPFQREGKWCAIIPSGRYFHAVNLETGEELWRHRWVTSFGCNAADPIVLGDQVFLCSGYSRGAALLKLTQSEPEVVWASKDLRNQFSSSLLIDGYIYGIDGDTPLKRGLKCLRLDGGAVQWTEDGIQAAAVSASPGRLIVLGEQGELVIARATPEKFHAVARAQVLHGKCWTVPVLSNGRIYCRSAEGELACVDVRSK